MGRATKDWVVVETTVEKAENLLNCDIIYYKQRFSDQLIMRAESQYHIPDALAEIVDFVAGLHGFPYASWQPIPSVSKDIAVGEGNTPTTVNDLYSITVPTGPCNCMLLKLLLNSLVQIIHHPIYKHFSKTMLL